jgi:hypothetical protein
LLSDIKAEPSLTNGVASKGTCSHMRSLSDSVLINSHLIRPATSAHGIRHGLVMRRPNLPSAQRSRGKNPTWYLMHIPECVHGVLGGTSAGPIGYSIGDSLGLSIGTPID